MSINWCIILNGKIANVMKSGAEEKKKENKTKKKPCRSSSSSTSTSFNLAFISHINRSKHVVISFLFVQCLNECVCVVYLEFRLLHLKKYPTQNLHSRSYFSRFARSRGEKEGCNFICRRARQAFAIEREREKRANKWIVCVDMRAMKMK